MGKFVRNIVVKQEFDGDTAVFTLMPLSHADATALYGSTKEQDEDAVLKALVGMLPRYTVSVTGITDSAGNAVEAAVVYEAVYFAPLIAAIAGEWLSRSMPGNSVPSGG